MRSTFLFALLLIFSIHAQKSVEVSKPLKVIYIDWRNIDWSDPSQTLLDAVGAGFNVVILAFYLSSTGATDMAQAWQGVDSATRKATMDKVHDAGAIAMVSFGGSTDLPYGKDPIQIGGQVAQWAIDNQLDGVDFDLENLGSGFVAQGLNSYQTLAWFANVTNAARNVLGKHRYISHAPQAPYFGPIGATWSWVGPTGGYSGVYQYAQSIDFFNVQFYNQGPTCYVDYQGLFKSSCNTFPATSVSEISNQGVPLEKIVVGKIVSSSDGNNGWVSASDLHSFFAQAQNEMSWNSGVMGWEWSDASTVQQWISTIY